MAKLKKDGKPKLSGGKRKGAGAPKKAVKKKSVTVCVYDVEQLKKSLRDYEKKRRNRTIG